MAQFQTADGRWLVGDVEGNGEYSGFLGWRDCVIQLTSNSATEQSVKYLEALRDYAFNRNSLGEPIAPSSVNVWVSNNGKTVAVQADDYAVDGNTFTICGIKWTGSTWDYTNAGQGGGGGGGSLVVNITQDGDSLICDKTAGEMAAALESGGIIIRRTVEQDGVTGYLYYPLSAASVAPDFFYSFTAANPIGTLTAASASDYPASGVK